MGVKVWCVVSFVRKYWPWGIANGELCRREMQPADGRLLAGKAGEAQDTNTRRIPFEGRKGGHPHQHKVSSVHRCS